MDYLSLVVGAALAIAGGLVGQLVAYRLKMEETKRNYRRDNLDQLAVAALEDRHWIDEFRLERVLTL